MELMIKFKEKALEYFLAPRDNKMTLSEILEMLEEAEKIINNSTEWNPDLSGLDSLDSGISLSESFAEFTIIDLMENVRMLSSQYKYFYELGKLSKQIENDN